MQDKSIITVYFDDIPMCGYIGGITQEEPKHFWDWIMVGGWVSPSLQDLMDAYYRMMAIDGPFCRLADRINIKLKVNDSEYEPPADR